ncbi:MAG: MBL fold metallo-hydrolase [Lachnospiraceae bacterium]|jgi:phosphoribosyl 1,2-cyclic phosphate phosphodiesterase
MKIHYLGTAAAEGCPALFCKCKLCSTIRSEKNPLDFRTRSQVLIDDSLLVDFPPDTYHHFLKDAQLDLSAVEHVIITHSHADHFYPDDFLMKTDCFSATSAGKLYIYGNQTVKLCMDTVITSAPDIYHAKDYLEAVYLAPYVSYSIGNHQVTPLLADHKRGENCYIYVIQSEHKTVLYANDTGIQLPDETWQQLKQYHFDLVSMDCTAMNRSVSRNHMGIPDNLFMKQKLSDMDCIDENTKFVLTHFSHFGGLRHHELVELTTDHKFIIAYDGFIINI